MKVSSQPKVFNLQGIYQAGNYYQGNLSDTFQWLVSQTYILGILLQF
jgi:hypothetical protein